jgi:hypothetical protein
MEYHHNRNLACDVVIKLCSGVEKLKVNCDDFVGDVVS